MHFIISLPFFSEDLANENLSNPSPHPFIEFWLYDHPTLSDRIAFCKEYIEQPAEPVKEEEELTTKD